MSTPSLFPLSCKWTPDVLSNLFHFIHDVDCGGISMSGDLSNLSIGAYLALFCIGFCPISQMAPKQILETDVKNSKYRA